MNNSFPPAALPSRINAPRHPEPYAAEDTGDFDWSMEGPPTDEESVLRRYWRILLKRKWVVLGAMALAVGSAIVLAMLTQPQYAATQTLEIQREADKVVDIKSSDNDSNVGRDPEFYQTQYELLKSRSLAEQVVRDLRLAQNDNFLSNFGATDASDLPTDRPTREKLATAIVMQGTQVVPVRLSGIVAVRYESPNPQIAAQVANSLGENFIESNLSRRFEASSYARRFLQNQLAQTREKLEASERQAVAYAGRNQIINIAPTSRVSSANAGPAPEQSLIAASLATANDKLAEARALRFEAENRYRQSGGRGALSNQALVNPALNALRQQRAELNAQFQKQLSDFGPEYPAVKALRAQIQELDRQVGVETGRVRESVEGDLAAGYRAAAGNERQLAAQVEQLKGQLLDQRQRSIQYNIFQREVDTNRALYDALLQRYKEVGVAGGVGTNNVSIVDRATPPGAPFKPNLMLNVMLGLLIGTMLGAAVAAVLEQIDESAISPEDFTTKLGVPLLGTIPVVGKDEDPAELLADPKSAVSEAYLSVLTGLRFSTAHGLPKSFLLTSTQPAEGKSTTAMTLARNLAKLGKRVILIDGDLRNPSLHKKLGITNERGLSTVLVGDATLQEVAVPTDVPDLFAVTAGPIPPNPAELLATGILRQILSSVADEFDHVVVDAPPVLGLADAPLLARTVEATVFILESKRTRTSQARQALSRIMAVRAPIAGAVLTKFDNRQAGYGYGYGYDYNYGK